MPRPLKINPDTGKPYLRVTVGRLKEVAVKKAGIVGEVAKVFGVDRQSIYGWIHRNEEVAQAFHNARETILDVAESHHIKKITEGDYTAVWNELRTKGKSRGYVPQTDVGASEELSAFILNVKTVPTTREPGPGSEREADRGLEPPA